LTIPKRLRVHTGFNRQLLGKLSSRASQAEAQRPDQADQSQELTYVDIDTFLESF
jgi:hypothetical protein